MHHVINFNNWEILTVCFLGKTLSGYSFVLERISRKNEARNDICQNSIDSCWGWKTWFHGAQCQVLCIHNILLHYTKNYPFFTCTGTVVPYINSVYTYGPRFCFYASRIKTSNCTYFLEKWSWKQYRDGVWGFSEVIRLPWIGKDPHFHIDHW